MNDVALEIKNQVDCKMFIERLGITINRKGFCCCPLHKEKIPSCKIYDGGKSWYCFGCNSGGDVITLAEKYYGLGFKDAVRRLAEDFDAVSRLNADHSVSNGLISAVNRAKVKSLIASKRSQKEALEAEYWVVYEKLLEIDRAIADFAPKSPDGEMDDRFVKALCEREQVRDRLERLEERRNPFYDL